VIGIYIRVSTREQAEEGHSIAAQRSKLSSYCNAMGWDNYKFYVDEGVSAKDLNRPELNRLISDVEKGNVNMILVYRLDRFTRKVIDLHKMLEVLNKHDCTFKSATEPYDTSSAMGRMFITLIAAIAQWETENLSERVKLALDEKVTSGERVGNIPFPFDLAEDETLVANPKRAQVTLKMIELLKSGMSSIRIAEYLAKTNSDRVAWHHNGVLRILRNPALYGSTRWNDKIVENTHEGIISKAEFDKIQQILKDRSHTRRREVKSTYLFQGVLICPNCGRPLNVNRYFRTRKDGSIYQGASYRCKVCAKAKTFTLNVGEPRILDALYEYMQDFTLDQIKQVEVKDDQSIYQEQFDQIEKKRVKYQRAWASDLMDDDEFKKLMDETRVIYEDLKEKLEQTPAPKKVDVESIKDIVLNFNENFRHLTQDEKRIFIATFIRQIHVKPIPQPPKDRRSKKGTELIVITDIVFY
jgi:DNA invertase Pin-like site-specific DNA recombinase